MFNNAMHTASQATHATLSIALAGAALLLATPRNPASALIQESQAGRPWFGFSIACSDCRMRETAAGAHWTFAVAPEIQAVEAGSPADRAGLRAGDVLMAIDAQSLTSEAGTGRLASIRAGQAATFSVRRGARMIEVSVTATTRPIVEVSPAPRVGEVDPASGSVLPSRFAGSFGNVQVDVRGPANTAVIIAERECWLEIRTGQAVVRLEAREGCSRR